MSYRLSTPVKPLIWVEASVEMHRGSRIEYMVKVSTPHSHLQEAEKHFSRLKHSLSDEVMRIMSRSTCQSQMMLIPQNSE